MSDVDDTATAGFPQIRNYCPRAPHRSHELEIEIFFPLGIADVLKLLGRRPTGIVYENINATEVTRHRRDELLNLRTFGDIDRLSEDFTSVEASNFCYGTLQYLWSSSTDCDFGALARQAESNPFTDPFTAASNNRNFTSQSQIHSTVLLFCYMPSCLRPFSGLGGA